MIGTVTRLARFTRVMYKPHYLLYGVLWVCALEATLALLAGAPWRPSWSTGLRVVIVAVVLLYLRMVDEQKDLEYDRVHNRDRPLVTGAVTATDLRSGMAVIAVLAVAGSLLLSVNSALAIAAVLLYGLGLWGLERISARVRDDILLNLVVTYPVQLLVTAYVLVSVLDTEGLAAGFWRLAPAALIFAGAFLQFEFARKTAHEPRPGEHYYSNVLGALGSTVVSLLFVALAVGADLALVRPWDHTAWWLGLLVVPLVLLPGYGAARFLRGGEYPLGPPVLFILGLYAVLIAQSAVGA
ncbi:hypothetical protein AB0H71_20055 [Nocardia sp. NPDC050697]|uniref:hypothetical protein n=1 Tax=Nocardia sp. NPDC050697 TaxID=3155158 RepID=UPI0033F0D092